MDSLNFKVKRSRSGRDQIGLWWPKSTDSKCIFFRQRHSGRRFEYYPVFNDYSTAFCSLFTEFEKLKMQQALYVCEYIHGRRSVGGQGTCPPTFWRGGDTLCFVPPTFSGVDSLTVTGFKPRPHQQHVEATCRTATGNMSKQQATCSIRRSTIRRSTCRKKLNMFNLFRHVERMKKSFDMLPKNGNMSNGNIRHVASTCCWCGLGFSDLHCIVYSITALRCACNNYSLQFIWWRHLA